MIWKKLPCDSCCKLSVSKKCVIICSSLTRSLQCKPCYSFSQLATELLMNSVSLAYPHRFPTVSLETNTLILIWFCLINTTCWLARCSTAYGSNVVLACNFRWKPRKFCSVNTVFSVFYHCKEKYTELKHPCVLSLLGLKYYSFLCSSPFVLKCSNILF